MARKKRKAGTSPAMSPDAVNEILAADRYEYTCDEATETELVQASDARVWK